MSMPMPMMTQMRPPMPVMPPMPDKPLFPSGANDVRFFFLLR